MSVERGIREAANLVRAAGYEGRERLGGGQTVEGLEALAEESVGAGSGPARRYCRPWGPGQVCGGVVEAGSAEQLQDVYGEGGAES